jgi:hypothetical protein
VRGQNDEIDPKPTSAPAAGVGDLIEAAKTKCHGL